MSQIQSVGTLRDTLRSLSVLVAGVQSLNEFLLVDILHRDPDSIADTVLPCLEYLWLTANPVASTIDYRVKVIEQFNARMSEICLDNEKASEKELDKARVLQALRIVKEGKTPRFLHNNNTTHSLNQANHS
ncbi:Nischarin [Eumeta japonica]|uniref:Nischarin n=1 Tax=Eumeta variegata TaxID=151549 RepID=A0A4C1XB26_EUMVA|nr:Nischarin [Eumeta japonica]